MITFFLPKFTNKNWLQFIGVYFFKRVHIFTTFIVTTARIKILLDVKEFPTKSIDISDQNHMLQDIFPSERIN